MRAPLAARKPGSTSALPWCGTFSTSARRSVPPETSRASASAPRSPVKSTRMPRTVIRTTIERSFGSAAAIARSGAGARTSTAAAPTDLRSPGTRTSRSPPVRRTSASRAPTRSSAGDKVPVATTPTSRPVSAPARPPPWSASRWDIRTNGRESIPSRSRHRSTAPTSGPASTRTPAPGPVGSTRASPCPTSHATTTVCAGGQPRTVCRSGQPSTTSPTRAASASGRSRGHRQSTHAAATTRPVRSTAPPVPAGQPVAPSGTAAARSATRTSQRVGHPAVQTRASPSAGTSGATTAAARPSTVAGATAGAASRFAGNDTRLTVPERPATIGAVATPAAALTAKASARTGQQPRVRNRRDHPGASRTMAAVAATESAKPASRARPGSSSRSTHTAAPNAGSAARGRPEASARSVTAPMAAARTTLGLGRARMTKPISARPATTACTRRSTARRRSGHSTPIRTIATFAPDTAVRWESPARRKSSSSTGSMAWVSPTTSPGSNPAGRGPRTRAADVASPWRSAPAIRWSRPASPTGVGGPRAETTATSTLPGSGGDTPTRTRTLCPGSRFRHCRAGAKRSTGAVNRCVAAPSDRAVTVAAATIRGSPAVDSTCGSPSRWRTTRTDTPASATDRRGEASRAAPRTAAVPAVTASPARIPRTRAAGAPRRIPTTAARPAATNAPPMRRPGASSGAPRLPAHTLAATGASRRSTHVQRSTVRPS
jgi:hypothetical protein